MHSLDRTRGGVIRSRGNALPNTYSSNRRDSRLNYNSSSIPYLNKRGGVGGGGVHSGLDQHRDMNGKIIGSNDGLKRPGGYDPVRLQQQ